VVALATPLHVLRAKETDMNKLAPMKKLALHTLTIRRLTGIRGGITIEPHPQTYGCPTKDSCPQHSDATCFSDCACTVQPK
jgi:hypothetical protein